MKIVYVDFCGTITTTATLYKFCKFVFLKHSIYTKLYFYLHYLLSRRMKIFDINLFLPFNNMSLNKLDIYAETFFNSILKPHINDKVIKYLNKASLNGYHVIIISGGLKNYIEHTIELIKFDKVIAKEFQLIDSQIKPNFNNGTVFQNDKIFQILNFEKQIDEQIEERIVISDSEDDIPLFLLADKKIVVNPSSKRLIELARHLNWELL